MLSAEKSFVLDVRGLLPSFVLNPYIRNMNFLLEYTDSDACNLLNYKNSSFYHRDVHLYGGLIGNLDCWNRFRKHTVSYGIRHYLDIDAFNSDCLDVVVYNAVFDFESFNALWRKIEFYDNSPSIIGIYKSKDDIFCYSNALLDFRAYRDLDLIINEVSGKQVFELKKK